MRRIARYALWLIPGLPALLSAQGFGVYEQNTCTMARGGVSAASPCPDGSAIFFSPAGLAGFDRTHLSIGATFVDAYGGFRDDVFGQRTDLKNPLIPVPAGYLTHAVTPKLTVGIGTYVPYGLETKWPTTDFEGRFFGYNTKLRSIYIQPTVAYQVHPRVKIGLGVAYVTSKVELHQRADLSEQVAAPGLRFSDLGIPTGTDFADGVLEATGNGVAVNFGAIVKITDRLSIGGHWLTKTTIDYDGTADFTQVLTGILLPAGNPLGLAAGTPLDLVVQPEFLAGQPLSDGGAKTSIVMPPQGSIGLAFKANDKWTVMADYHLIVWGWFNTLVIDFANPTTPDLTLRPNNKDTHGIRLGAEFQYSPKVTLRGGYIYHGGASPSEFVTPLLPEGARNAISVGLSAKLTEQLNGELAYQHIRQDNRRGRVFPNPAVGNTGVFEFSGHLFGVGLAYTF